MHILGSIKSNVGVHLVPMTAIMAVLVVMFPELSNLIISPNYSFMLVKEGKRMEIQPLLMVAVVVLLMIPQNVNRNIYSAILVEAQQMFD